jgi:pyruvate,water dikinase
MTDPPTCSGDPPLIPLDQAHDPRQCGAKAVALARLAAAGLPVPSGLVVPAALPDDHLPDAARRLCSWAAAHARYGLVARSSAVGEDGSRASFAGLYSSRFTPANPDLLAPALRAVRASAHSTTAAAYGHRSSDPTHQGTRRAASPAAMAILVQPAIRPYAAGVLATHTTSGRATRWFIEATYGLAEPLVGGTQTGDIHTGGDAPEQTILADKTAISLPVSAGETDMPPGEWILLPDPSGAATPAKIAESDGTLLRVHRPASWYQRPALTKAHRTRLIHTAEAAADTLALDRIDIEWVIDTAGRLWLLQARPLTAPLPNTDLSRAATRRGKTWHAIPASPGIGVGPAAHLTPDTVPRTAAGRILICGPLSPDAVPALLASPAAVIATTGGPLSHTAIITRELAIPCVTALTNALAVIPPGATTRVDGTTGTVTLDDTTPVPTTEPADLSDAAVLLATPPNDAAPCDRRRATLLLHTADDDLDSNPALAGNRPGAAPVGVFQPTIDPAFPVIPTDTKRSSSPVSAGSSGPPIYHPQPASWPVDRAGVGAGGTGSRGV